MTKAIEYTDGSECIYGRNRIFRTRHADAQNRSEIGVVATDYGYVWVSIWHDKNGSQATTMTFIVNGRQYRRHYDKALTQLGAVRKACEFAKEITEGPCKS